MAEDKNRMKKDFDLQFISENIFIEAVGHLIANRVFPGKISDDDVLALVEASIKAATIFKENKARFGIRDRVTNDLEKIDEKEEG